MPKTKTSTVRRGCASALIAVVLLTSCSHSGKSHATSPTPTTSTKSASAARSSHLLTIGKIDVESAGKAARVSATTQHAVLAVAQRYVNSAILTPLETGRLGPEYAQIFAGTIRPAAIGIDQSRLTDLAVGRSTSFTETSTPVTLSVLTDQSGAFVYAATDFKVNVSAATRKGQITISRSVELTVERDGNRFFVVAYRTTVRRTAPVAKPTTPTTRRPRPRATTTTTRPRKKAPKP